MLVKFSVENFLSFKEKAEIDFEAGTIKEHKENIYDILGSKLRLLKSIAILGGNSSGKSNFIKAFLTMRDIVSGRLQEQLSEKVSVIPFRLSTKTEGAPSIFDSTFIVNSEKYRYGFSVQGEKIVEEWLFCYPKRREENIYMRVGDSFNIGKTFTSSEKSKVNMLLDMTGSKSLLITVLSKFNISLGQTITNWFTQALVLMDSTDHDDAVDYTASFLDDPEYKKLIFTILERSDLGFTSIEEEIKERSMRLRESQSFISALYHEEIKHYNIKTKHIKYDENGRAVENILFDLKKHESSGTQRFFGMLGPIVKALRERRLLWVDELDSKLHNALMSLIVDLFNSNVNNPNGAQLVFVIHNTNILTKNLRRDQMALVEKDKFGASTIGTVYNNMPAIRNDASFEKDYLKGKYGAIPNINQLKLF